MKRIETHHKARLFLVCPNGFMESPLHKKFGENCYFYTAMTAFFDWDGTNQNSFLDFIQHSKINEIYFIGNVNNPLYIQFFDLCVIPPQVPWERELAKSYTGLKTEIQSLPEAKIKVRLLLANHLMRQIARLSEVPLLRNYINTHDINVNALLYDPSEDHFTSAAKANEQSRILKGISYN